MLPMLWCSLIPSWSNLVIRMPEVNMCLIDPNLIIFDLDRWIAEYDTWTVWMNLFILCSYIIITFFWWQIPSLVNHVIPLGIRIINKHLQDKELKELVVSTKTVEYKLVQTGNSLTNIVEKPYKMIVGLFS